MLRSNLALSANNELLAATTEHYESDKVIKIFDFRSGIEQRTLVGHLKSVRSVAFSPVGDLLTSGSYDKDVMLWNPVTGIQRGTFPGHSDAVISVAFSPNGKLLASGSSDGTVKLWDPHKGELRSTLKNSPLRGIFTGR
jgi:WD40 repeat protein